MTKSEIVAGFAEALGVRLSRAAVEQYVRALSDLDPGQLMDACVAALRERTRLPAPAELREFAAASPTTEDGPGDEAHQELRRWIDQVVREIAEAKSLGASGPPTSEADRAFQKRLAQSELDGDYRDEWEQEHAEYREELADPHGDPIVE